MTRKMLPLITGGVSPVGTIASIGLLVLRVGSGGLMLVGHGMGKLTGFGNLASTFPDPLGVGSTLSLVMAVFAEVVCSAAVILGFATRLAVVPLVVTMVVAAMIVHSADPFQTKELAIVYLVFFVTIFFTGPGRYSVDAILARRR
jgi:putative oxidoreductase